MNIQSFILINGQEVIAEVLSEEVSHFVVERPLNVHMMRGPDGSPQIGFAPMSIIRLDKPVQIYKSGLVSPPLDVEKDVADSYIQNTTGLITGAAVGQILQG